eukprot:UN34214
MDAAWKRTIEKINGNIDTKSDRYHDKLDAGKRRSGKRASTLLLEELGDMCAECHMTRARLKKIAEDDYLKLDQISEFAMNIWKNKNAGFFHDFTTLDFGRKLGKGNFGEVYKGNALLKKKIRCRH